MTTKKTLKMDAATQHKFAKAVSSLPETASAVVQGADDTTVHGATKRK